MGYRNEEIRARGEVHSLTRDSLIAFYCSDLKIPLILAKRSCLSSVLRSPVKFLQIASDTEYKEGGMKS